MIVFPYSYDGQEYDDPERIPYSEEGLSAWMLKKKRPYAFSMDQGRLHQKGKSYGDTERASRDSVAVPLIDLRAKPKDVLGILCIQSYRPHPC